MARTTIPAELVAVNAIQGTLIADNSVTAVHIATNAISGTLVADNAVTSTHIAQNQVTATQIAQNTITVTQMADDAIETAKINASAVTTAKINNGAVTDDKLAANSVTSAKIVNGTIVAADLADNAVTIAKMASLARGSIIYGDSAGDPAALSIGSNGTALVSDGTDISWGAAGETNRLPLAGGVMTGNLDVNGNELILDADADTSIRESADDYLIMKVGGTDLIKIDASGLGIGIRPAEMLDIQSASGDARIRLDAPSGSDTELKFFNNATAEYTIGHDDGTDNFVIGGANVDIPLVSVNKSGNVGIGETTPLGKLHVKTADSGASVNSNADDLVIEGSGTAGITILSGTTGDGNLFFDDSGGFARGKLSYSHNGDYLTLSSSGASIFYNGGSERMRILSGGNVGIGTTSPSEALTVTGNANISGSTTVGGIVTANHMIKSDAGHNTARFEAIYNDQNSTNPQYNGNMLMWVSEPGITYDSGGIGTNVHPSGQYYGRAYNYGYSTYMRFSKSDGNIIFYQNQGTSGSAGAAQTETLRITANGTLRLATSGGIGFGSTGAADTLDDYEEGNFTPVFAASGGTAPSSQTGTGQYTRIGDVVHVTGQIVWNGAGSGGVNMYFTLPFNLISDARGGFAIGLNSGVSYTADHMLHLIPEINTNVVYLVSSGHTGAAHTHLNFGNVKNSGSKIFSFGGVYHTRD